MIHYELKYVYQQRINVRKYVRHFDHVPTRVRVRMKFHLLSIHRQRNAASRTVIGHSYQSLLSMQICEIYNNFIDRTMKTRIGLYYSLDNIIRDFFFFLWNLTKRVFYKNYTIFLQFVVLNNNEDIYITKILQDFVYYTLKSFAILLIYRWTRTNPLTKTVVKFFSSDLFPYYPKWSSRTARAVWKIWPSPPATHKTQDSKWRRNKYKYKNDYTLRKKKKLFFSHLIIHREHVRRFVNE